MNERLVRLVQNLGRPKVVVLGDLILDRYVWGDAERISQEAPVILLRADRREERLGGAASVASMLAVLGADVHLAGLVGEDKDADAVRTLLDEYGIRHSMVFADVARPTTVKERYIGRAQQKHPQQMMRVDFEVRDPASESMERRLATALAACIETADVVLISDYDKGVCTPTLNRVAIDAARTRGVKSLVDPIRGGDYKSRYFGCTSMTPNRLEAGLASGVTIADPATAMKAAERLRDEVGMEAGLVTLDKEGMVLVDDVGGRHFPCRPREVYDITGAGDMVLAVLGMTLAAGAQFPDAIAIANAAGGLEVERIGVATITRDEIVADLEASSARRGKVLTLPSLLRDLDRRRSQKQRIVFTNGCFDILHVGHVQYLREAKAQGDVLVVGLNTDASVRRQDKGADRPINGESSRAELLAALETVDYVCLFDEETPAELITAVRPDVLVKGADYRPDQVVGAEFVQSYGGRLHLAALAPGYSTTATLAKLKAAA
jgi:D-beta-D-heptose 7-phosphate kinase/D-beta-D-heptose 1-phosphate adenosyltransferase